MEDNTDMVNSALLRMAKFLMLITSFLAFSLTSHAITPNGYCGHNGKRCEAVIKAFAAFPEVLRSAVLHHIQSSAEGVSPYDFLQCADDSIAIAELGSGFLEAHLGAVALLAAIQNGLPNGSTRFKSFF